MKVDKTRINDCVVIKLDKFDDDRGFFFEAYNKHRYVETLGNGCLSSDTEWQQTNCSFSHKGVVRGIHIVPFAKLVTCVHGYVMDVVVDMRKDSPTYLKWIAVDLMGEYPTQVYVPPGCGHGFLAFEESVVMYSQTGTYDPKLETSVNWLDKTLNIYWPKGYDYILSPKDQAAPHLVCDECGGSGYGIYGMPGTMPCQQCNRGKSKYDYS